MERPGGEALLTLCDYVGRRAGSTADAPRLLIWELVVCRGLKIRYVVPFLEQNSSSALQGRASKRKLPPYGFATTIFPKRIGRRRVPRRTRPRGASTGDVSSALFTGFL